MSGYINCKISLVLLAITVLQTSVLSGKNSPAVTSKAALKKAIIPVNHDAPVVPGVVLVKKMPEGVAKMSGPSVQTILAKAGAMGEQPVFKSTKSASTPLARISQIVIPEHLDPRSVAETLNESGAVEWAEPLYIPEICYVPNDPDLNTQWYLGVTKIREAWDIYRGDAAYNNLVIAIVDNGIQIAHPDLAANIWTNPAEIANNGLDDDGNGYVDDVHGWDFGNDDNDPAPNPSINNSDKYHGTAVAGVISAVADNGTGIAGVSFNAKVMPVKTSPDTIPRNPIYGYLGIVYAAENGADIINCSWGATGASNFSAETLEYVDSLGVLVIAAAGNEASEQSHYPSGFPSVYSIAATTQSDLPASFTNFQYNVDLCAPGTFIYTTNGENGYSAYDGTSLSAPIVTGAAALVMGYHPGWTAKQVGEQIRVTCDPIVLSTEYEHKMGYGRLNVERALQESVPSIRLTSSEFIEDPTADGNGVFDPGEIVQGIFTFTNFLIPIAGFDIEVISSNPHVTVLNSTQTFGSMATLENISSETTPVLFNVDPATERGESTVIEIRITGPNSYENSDFVILDVAPLYSQIQNETLTLTLTSTGRLGFTDYPANTQGEGFIYKEIGNMLFEGAFMAASGPARVSDVARCADEDADYQNEDWNMADGGDVLVSVPGTLADEEGRAVFSDAEAANAFNLLVTQKSYAFYDEPDQDFVILVYEMANKSGSSLSNLYAGLFIDWDINESSTNLSGFDASLNLGYISDGDQEAFGGLQLLTDYLSFQYHDIDNNAEIYDGYTDAEKWTHLSGGVYQASDRSPKDYSHVVGAGPFDIPANGSQRLSLALLGGESLEQLRENSAQAIAKYRALFPDDTSSMPEFPEAFKLYQNYPNPFDETTTLSIDVPHASHVTLTIYNLLGREVARLLDGVVEAVGQKEILWNPSETGIILANGVYFAQMQAGGFRKTIKMVRMSRE